MMNFPTRLRPIRPSSFGVFSKFLFAIVLIGLVLTAQLKSSPRSTRTSFWRPLEVVAKGQNTNTSEAYFIFDYPPHPETFVFKLTDPAKIQQARELLTTGQSKIIAGTIIKQPVYYNTPWSFHLDPKTIGFIDGAVELCDSSILGIEVNLDRAWPGWCPWTSRLLREISPPAKPGDGNINPTVSMTNPYADFTSRDVAPANVTLEANADDPDGEIVKVEFFHNAGKIGESTTYPYRVIWNNLPAANYTVFAVATDDKGAATVSKSVTFTITQRSNVFNGRIAFTRMVDKSQPWPDTDIFTMKSDGSEQTNITNNPARDTGPVWSPDGTTVAFASDRGQVTYRPGNIFTMKVDGSQITNITKAPDATDFNIETPEWSPDGKAVLFTSKSFGIPSLYRIAPDGNGQQKAVTYGIGPSGHRAVWSPDGMRLSFAATTINYNFTPARIVSLIYVLNVDGTGLTMIFDAGGTSAGNASPANSSPAWSPDGKTLAFVNYQDGNAEIYTITADGRDLRRLTKNPANDTAPTWSPDGTRIAFTSDRDGNQEIYVMENDGSSQTRLTNNLVDDYDPSWQMLGFSGVLPPAMPTIQFSSPTDTVQEANSAGAVIRVTRLGDLSGSASIRYATSDGTASPRSDYTPVFGTLRFAPGQGEAQITIPIIDNVLIQADRTVNIALSEPQGALPGAATTAVLTITDNDSVPPITHPLDTSQFYVRQHYYDFLSRLPDQSGFDYWINQIALCGSDERCIEVKRVNVSAAFFLSIEFQQTGYLVERLYKVAYGDGKGVSTWNGSHQLDVPIVRFNEFLPETQKVGEGVVVLQPGWEQKLENNKQAFALDFVQQSRFTAAFPDSITPEQFVDRLNQNAGNVLSASERADAISLFSGAPYANNKAACAQALRQVAENRELYNREFNRAFVLMQYFGYLRRNPDDAPEATRDYTGYDFWLKKLNQFNGNFVEAEMVKAFITSIEYRQRFAP